MVEYSDTHTVLIPEGWTATNFASQVLGNAPAWLTHLLDVRDWIVGKLGFATQPGDIRKKVDITVGGTAGPFTFTEVSDAAVVGGNDDNHIVFCSTFCVEQTAGQLRGVMETRTHSKDALGAAYLTAIWPMHKLLMQRILRSGMSGVRVKS